MCKKSRGTSYGIHGNAFIVLAVISALSSFIDEASSYPSYYSNPWPEFDQDLEALVRSYGFGPKRSIANLAKNGQLPTFRAPNDGDKDSNNDEGKEKRNLASIRKSESMKRNIESLAKSGSRSGKRNWYYDTDFEKKNIGSLARNGYIQQNVDKRGGDSEEEYFNPFFQNPAPPSEVDGQQYNYQHSSDPSFLPFYPQSVYDKRDLPSRLDRNYYLAENFQPQSDINVGLNDIDADNFFKKESIGLPNHGIYRQKVVDPAEIIKRYLTDIINHNGEENYAEEQESGLYKRSVGSIPLTRISELGTRHGPFVIRQMGYGPGEAMKTSAEIYVNIGYCRQCYVGLRNVFTLSLKDPGLKEVVKIYNLNLNSRKYVTTKGGPPTHPYYSSLPSPAVFANEIQGTHVRGRPLDHITNNELPTHSEQPGQTQQREVVPPYLKAVARNHWEFETHQGGVHPKFFNFKSFKIPNTINRRPGSDKRFLLMPAMDKILLQKSYPNSNLPSRRKNQ